MSSNFPFAGGNAIYNCISLESEKKLHKIIKQKKKKKNTSSMESLDIVKIETMNKILNRYYYYYYYYYYDYYYDYYYYYYYYYYDYYYYLIRNIIKTYISSIIAVAFLFYFQHTILLISSILQITYIPFDICHVVCLQL